MAADIQPTPGENDVRTVLTLDRNEHPGGAVEKTAATFSEQANLSAVDSEDRTPASAKPNLLSTLQAADSANQTQPMAPGKEPAAQAAPQNTSSPETETALRNIRSRTSETKQSRDLHSQTAHVGPEASVAAGNAGGQRIEAESTRDSSAVLSPGASPGMRGDAADVVATQVMSTSSTGRDFFAALDGVQGTGTPHWVHVGARQAEAGFQDPEAGWVAVRAHAAADGIHAALIPGSTDAAHALGDHLAGLNAYLSAHHPPVQSVTVSTPEMRWDGQTFGQGSNHETGQGNAQERQPSVDAIPDVSDAGVASRRTASAQPIGSSDPPDRTPPGSRYISVMA
jgi:hypothetical protein